MCLFVNYSHMFRSDFLAILRELVNFSVCSFWCNLFGRHIYIYMIIFTIKIKILFSFFSWNSIPPHPPVGHGLFIPEVSRTHTQTHRTRQNSSGRVISSAQRPPPDNTQHSQQTPKPAGGIRTHNLSRRVAADPFCRCFCCCWLLLWLGWRFLICSSVRF